MDFGDDTPEVGLVLEHMLFSHRFFKNLNHDKFECIVLFIS